MTALDRMLGLRRGERGRALLLFLYLFLVISTYVAGKATRDALFLGQYDAARLPYADTAIAVGVAVLVALYVRVHRRVNLFTLQAGSLLFFASNAFALWWLGRLATVPAWHPVVVYVWVGIFGVIGPVQVWTLANYVLTLREAKRLFGVIGSGAILGWVLGGLMTAATAHRYGAEHVLLAVAAALAGCSVVVFFIWRRRPTSLAECAGSAEAVAPNSLCESLGLVCRSRYLRAVALVIAFSAIATGVAAWQFKAIAQAHMTATNDLAAFFGWFNVWAGLLALATQCLLTSRVLRRFGVGVGLFVVPVALTLGSAGLLAWGTLAAVVILKGSDHVLRYSIDKATVESLFLPVPPEQTFHAKLVIDAIVWRAGDMASSAILLAAVGGLGLSAVHVTWINLALLAGWMAAAWAAYRCYVGTLTETIQQHRLDTSRASAPVLDRSFGDLVTSSLASASTDDVLYGMALLDVSHHGATHPAVRPLLTHPTPKVRARAIAILREARDASVLPVVEGMLNDDDVHVRTEALLYVSHYGPIDPLARIREMGDFDDYSIRSALVAFLARPGAGQNLDAASLILDRMVREDGPGATRTRLEAARLIGTLPNQFERQLRLLLADADIEVAREAVRAAGRLGRRSYVEAILELWTTPELAVDAADALVACGDGVVGALRDRLLDADEPIALRRMIPDVLRRIGTVAARDALLENLITADTILRFRIIAALNGLREAHRDYPFDTEVIDTVLLAEIMGHYRSYGILGTLGQGAGADDPVTSGLRTSMTHELERIFRLLQLRIPDHDIWGAYMGVQSSNPLVRDQGLELLDHVLESDWRLLLLPLVDPEVSVEERIERANQLVGRGPGNREEAVSALIYSEDPWLKACAAYSIGALHLHLLRRELDRWVDDPDPLLRETARLSKAQIAETMH